MLPIIGFVISTIAIEVAGIDGRDTRISAGGLYVDTITIGITTTKCRSTCCTIGCNNGAGCLLGIGEGVEKVYILLLTDLVLHRIKSIEPRWVAGGEGSSISAS